MFRSLAGMAGVIPFRGLGNLNNRAMRTWINTVEGIDSFIKRCGFTHEDKSAALFGYCGNFALALHDFLSSIGHKSTIVFCVVDHNGKPAMVDKRCRPDPNGTLYWQHVLVEVDGQYYDIRGQVSRQAIESEFLTEHFVPVSRAKAESIIKLDSAHAYSVSKINRWKAVLHKQ